MDPHLVIDGDLDGSVEVVVSLVPFRQLPTLLSIVYCLSQTRPVYGSSGVIPVRDIVHGMYRYLVVGGSEVILDGCNISPGSGSVEQGQR